MKGLIYITTTDGKFVWEPCRITDATGTTVIWTAQRSYYEYEINPLCLLPATATEAEIEARSEEIRKFMARAEEAAEAAEDFAI
jgi:hypothetical protein